MRMRIRFWLGGIVLIAALGVGQSIAQRPSDSARPLAASTHQLVASMPLEDGSYLLNLLPLLRPPAPSNPPRTATPGPVPHAAAPVSGPRPAPPPRIVVETNQQALTNQDRASFGLAPLTWSSCLYSVALSNAKRMAAQGYISHTNGVYKDLACGLGHQSGENVGWWSGGINDSQLNRMFMASPDHKANILGHYHYVATAWAVGANGYAYLAVEFD
jgi:uncharacterized protein YkwD